MTGSGSPWTEHSWKDIREEHNVYLPASYSSLSICLWRLLKAEYQAELTVDLTMSLLSHASSSASWWISEGF